MRPRTKGKEDARLGACCAVPPNGDVDTIRRLRNQQANRDVSLTSHEIGADEGAAWWAKASVDPTRRVLIYERAGTTAGVVNFFDVDGSTGAWGFSSTRRPGRAR